MYCPDRKFLPHETNQTHALLLSLETHFSIQGMWWPATTQQFVGSIPDGIIGIFRWQNPSGRTMSLGSTQPPTQMSTRNISLGGKGGRYVGMTTLPPLCADCLEIWEPQTAGALGACTGIALPLPFQYSHEQQTILSNLLSHFTKNLCETLVSLIYV